jgi:hypothetical protein
VSLIASILERNGNTLFERLSNISKRPDKRIRMRSTQYVSEQNKQIVIGDSPMSKRFTAVITKEEQWYVAHCVELGVVSQGKTIE